MNDLYRSGITDLDNVPTPLYQRVLDTFPARLDVDPVALGLQLIREAAAASAYGYASPAACNVVAARWIAELDAARAA